MSQSRPRSWISPQVQAVTAAVLSVLFGSWAADEGRDLFDRLSGRGGDDSHLNWYLAGTAFTMAVFLLSLYWLYRLRKVWTHPRTRLKQLTNPPAYPILVLFLSNLDVDRGGYRSDSGIPEAFSPTGDLDADLRTLEELKQPGDGSRPLRWPWEMSLRGVRHHVGTLRRVIVFCSDESLDQAHWFGRLLKRQYEGTFADVDVKLALDRSGDFRLVDCPTEGPLVRGPDDRGWDFEDFDGLSWGMVRLLEALGSEGARANQVVIDFTSGQKPNSVVGASVTFNRDTVCQYVRTEPPHRVIHYDLVLTTLEDEGT